MYIYIHTWCLHIYQEISTSKEIYNLLLPERTQVTVAPESFTYTTNETMLTISCTSETDDSTTLTVEWRHRGVTLRSGYDPCLNITEGHTIIIDVEGMELQEISNRFSGEYTCIASNGYTSGTGVSQRIVPGALPTGKLKPGQVSSPSCIANLRFRSQAGVLGTQSPADWMPTHKQAMITGIKLNSAQQSFIWNEVYIYIEFYLKIFRCNAGDSGNWIYLLNL